MPVTTQWYVRTALLYLLASAALGVAWQLDQWRGVFGFGPYVRVVHTHLALMGGVVQMIMGVALWMFPQAQPIERRFPFRQTLAWTAYGLFNGGLLGRFVVEAAFRSGGGDVYGALTFLTGLMQLGAMLVFIAHLWALRTSKRDREKRDSQKQ